MQEGVVRQQRHLAQHGVQSRFVQFKNGTHLTPNHKFKNSRKWNSLYLEVAVTDHETQHCKAYWARAWIFGWRGYSEPHVAYPCRRKIIAKSSNPTRAEHQPGKRSSAPIWAVAVFSNFEETKCSLNRMQTINAIVVFSSCVRNRSRNKHAVISPSGQVDHATPPGALLRDPAQHAPIDTVEYFSEQTEFGRRQRRLFHLSHCLHGGPETWNEKKIGKMFATYLTGFRPLMRRLVVYVPKRLRLRTAASGRSTWFQRGGGTRWWLT